MEKYTIELMRPDNVSVKEMENYIQEAICLYPFKDSRFDLKLPVTVKLI